MRKILLFILLIVYGSLAAQTVNDVAFTGDYFNKYLLDKHLPRIENTRATHLREDTINNIVIFITFPGEDFTITKAKVDSLLNGKAPGSSLYSYYRDISNGKVKIISTFFPNSTEISAFMAPNPRYNYEIKEMPPELGQNLLASAWESVAEEVNASFPEGNYMVWYIVQGAPTEWSYFLWSDSGGLIMEGDLINRGRATLVHEMYHVLGAPDLYVHPPGSLDISPVGCWDPMESGSQHPQSSLTYITDTCGKFIPDSQIKEITETGDYTLYDSWDRDTTHHIAYKIKSPTSNEGEFFMLEYRRKTGGTIYEENNPDEGILISRINPTAFFKYGGNAGSNGTPEKPFGIYVYRKDGTDVVNGKLDTACFRAGGLELFDDLSSNPSAFLSNNKPGLGGIVIDQFSVAGNDSMTFHVTFPDAGPWFIGKPDTLKVMAWLTDGVLDIWGEGDMIDWDMDNLPPWYDVRERIEKVDIQTITSSGVSLYVTNIGNYAFYQCEKLTTVNIPDSVKSIGLNAFSQCTELPIIKIPTSVKTIGTAAFIMCAKLAKVTIPDSNNITYIGKQAFQGCSSLQSFTIPVGLTIINESVFRKSGLKSIDIPCNVKAIDFNAFEDCKFLKEVWICDSVTYMGTDEVSSVFKGCTGLTDIWVKWENPPKIIITTFGGIEPPKPLKDINLHIPCRYYDIYLDAKFWNDLNIVGEPQTVTVSADPLSYGTVKITDEDGNVFSGQKVVQPISCGEEVTITAIPNTGRKFVNWTTTNGTIVSTQFKIKVTKDSTFVAHFETESYTITLATNLPGAATLTGGGTYDYETEIEVKAVPDECYTFINWTKENGDIVSTNLSFKYNVTGNSTLTANFKAITYGIQLYAYLPTPNGGTVEGNGSHDCGKKITVKAIPDQCYTFKYWTENGTVVSTDANYVFEVTRPRILIAHFEMAKYMIILTANPEEGGTVYGSGSYFCDSLATVIATPEECYDFVCWTDNVTGECVSYDSIYTFPVTENRNLVANFERRTYNVTVSANPPYGGYFSVEPPDYSNISFFGMDIPCGENITVEAIELPCYEFVEWTDGETGEWISNNSSLTFTVVESRNLVAHFTLRNYNLILLADPEDGGEFLVNGEPYIAGATYPCGAPIEIMAVANDCYIFTEWTGEFGGTFDHEVWSFQIFGDSTLTAHFVQKTYDISVLTDPWNGGTAEIEGDGTNILCGDSITITATPENCWKFTYWTANEKWVSNNASYKFPVTHSQTLIAHFVPEEHHNVIVLADPADGGAVSGDGTYDCGTEITIIATPNECYTFISWTTEDGTFVSNDDSLTFEVISDSTLVAHFEIKSFNVVLSADPSDGGTVSGAGTYDCGTEITVIATPSECYTFVNWTTQSGNFISSNDTLTFTVTHDSTLVAHFEVKSFNIVLSAEPLVGGTVSGDGTYDCGTEVTIIATPDECYTFSYWTKEDETFISNNDTLTFTVTHDTTLVAHFEIKSFNIVLSEEPITGGTVLGDGTYDCGTEITIIATPNECYTFVNWTTEDGTFVSNNDTLTLTVISDSTLVAHFKIKSFNVVLSADPSYGGTVSGAGTYDCDTEITVIATPNECYTFLYWTTEDGTFVSNDLELVVTSDTVLVAHFEVKSFDILLLAEPLIGGTVSGDGTYDCGTEVTVIATPDECYTFLYWTKEDETFISNDDTLTFTVTHDTALVAHFVIKKFDVTLFTEPTTSGAVSGGGNYNCGDTITIVATPKNCHSFICWRTPDGAFVSANAIYSLVVTEDITLIAHFTDSAKITVMVDPPGVGTVTGSGLHPCGETIFLMAAAIDDCYKFVNWTNEEGGVVSPNNPYIFTVTGSKTLIANFELKKFNVYVIADPTGGGTVSGNGNYNCGDTATVTAIPANCYHFVNWTIDNIEVSTQPLYEFPVTELSILVAHFAKDTCVITLAANPPAGGNPIGSGSYECGKSAVAMAGTNSCYTFINWTKNGEEVSTQENYPFTVEETCTLIANFTLKSYYIAVSPDPPTGGLAIESDYHNCGNMVSVIAIPFSDYHFVNWTENGAVVSTNSTYTFEVTSARDLVAHFALKTYEITVQIDPDATCGEVSGGGTYNLGDIATVKADTGLCCKFLYWMEGVNVVSIDNPYSFPVTEPRTLVAKFESNTFDVSLVANPPEGGEAFYEENYCDTVTVTAIPNECWEFVNWTDESGVEVSNTFTYTFPITEDCNLTANFIQITYNVIVVSDPLTGGTVSVNDTTFLCASDGTSLTIEAFPEECYTFIGWWTQNGDYLSTDNPYTFNVIKSDTLVAKFEIKSFTVNLSADPPSFGTISGNGTYNCGDTITITATPNSCHSFTGWWTQDNILISEDNPYTFVVTEDITLVAHFTDSAKITVITNPQGVGNVTGDGFYLCYQTAILTATAIDDCYKFVNWTNEDGDTISPNNPYIFAVTGSQTLHANFELKNFNVYVMADPTGGGTVSGDGNYSCGDTATLTAIPANCYHFVNWTINNIEVSTQPLYKFPVTGLSIVVAHFAKDTCVITLVANPPVGGNPIGSGSYECGKSAVAMAGTNSCYTFSNWMKNGQVVSTQENYPFTVEETCTLIANFVLNSYSITVSSDPLNGGLAIESGTHNCGDTVSVIAIPFSDYNFINWTENGAVVSTNSIYTFEVTAARDLVAHFALKTGEITVQIAPAECDEDSVSGGGIYNLGEIATVTVISNPNSCCNFIGWMENGAFVYLEPVYSFEVTGSCTLVAKFERKTYDITLSAEPSIGGSVSGGGTDILCGETTTATAIPADCYSFVNWSNENGEVVSTDNPWSFEVRKNSNFTANFVLSYYDVTVVAEPTAGGTASGGGTNIPCDSLITVTATPETCYTFAGWWAQDGNFVTINNPYTFNVIKNDTLVAYFEIIGFNILLSKEPSIGGTVSGDGVYDCGTTVSISVTPDSCYTFVNWTTDDGTFVSNDANLTFEATNDTAFVAHFEIKSFDVILSADPLAGGTVAGEGTYDCGTEITVIATPDTGYVFVNWTTQNGTSVSNDANYKFEVINDCTLVAHFESKTFDVDVKINTSVEHCGGEVSGGGSYRYGDNVTVVATVAGECCGFANWTINGVVVSTNVAYTFTVTESVTLIANFEIPQYRVTLLTQDTLYGTTIGTGLYKACSTVRIIAHEQDCYTFANWTTIDGEEITKNVIHEFVVTKDTMLIANFSALDFDTYCPTLWCNTFMLDMNRLGREYSKVEDCKWYIDGKEIYDTQTLDQFSYSAGPNFDNKLLCGVPYMFKVKLENRTNWLCSTPKVIIHSCCNVQQSESSKKLIIFPNPTMSNSSFTVENVIVGKEVQVYNQFGVCINSIMATGDVISMTLNVPSGIYMIRCGERNGKIVVIR